MIKFEIGSYLSIVRVAVGSSHVYQMVFHGIAIA